MQENNQESRRERSQRINQESIKRLNRAFGRAFKRVFSHAQYMLHASVRDNTRTTESMSKKYKTQRTRTAHTTTTTTTTRTHQVDSRLCFPVPMLLACWVHNCVTAPGTARGWRKRCRHLQQNGCAAQWSLEMVWRKTHRALPGAGASAAATSNKIGNYHRTRCCH